MNEFTNREISDYFSTLTPEQFTADTSFYRHPLHEAATFDSFLAEHLHTTEIAFASSDGDAFPIAALSTDRSTYYFKVEDDESLTSFLERLRIFARVHKCRWLYFFQRLSVQVDDNERSAVYWLAGHQHETAVDYRQGYFDTDGQVLGMLHQAPENSPTPPLLREVLEGSA